MMFCGDMLLYFTVGELNSDGTFNPYFDAMKNRPISRIKSGGLLGSAAAFFYCIAYLHIALSTAEDSHAIALAVTLICCLGIIVGATYHSHFTCIGMLGRNDNPTDNQE